MNIAQISIQQTYAQIGITSSPAQLAISSPPATLNLHQEPAQLEITRTPGILYIDQTEAFNEEGLMDTVTLSKEAADLAKQDAFQATGEIAQMGDEFAHIEKKTTPFKDWARRDADRQIDVGIGVIPQAFSVHFQYEPTRIDIQVQLGGVSLNPEIHQPEVNYQAGEVSIYMKQYPSLTITPPPLPGQLLDSQI